MSLPHLRRMGTGHPPQAFKAPPIQQGARFVEKLHQDGGDPSSRAANCVRPAKSPAWSSGTIFSCNWRRPGSPNWCSLLS